jgi:hypothetical protein
MANDKEGEGGEWEQRPTRYAPTPSCTHHVTLTTWDKGDKEHSTSTSTSTQAQPIAHPCCCEQLLAGQIAGANGRNDDEWGGGCKDNSNSKVRQRQWEWQDKSNSNNNDDRGMRTGGREGEQDGTHTHAYKHLLIGWFVGVYSGAAGEEEREETHNLSKTMLCIVYQSSVASIKPWDRYICIIYHQNQSSISCMTK